ncbi:TPA: glutathione S-transferase family protein [Providencia alcalifaciens]|uniref:Glutathione S-transferase n=2 Tax=Providencia alcalifaciens TaxID=126385 RepID=A0AAW9V7R8_9GAMM|nr:MULTISPECIES: glutathione S-transferase family protein [Providencia]ATG18096.1 glutathione S-transferase family protein [Providencia alcalifaciens]EEB47006.1 glutathione S-transferase, C-terminal domain protein [Providencia alcalifaciens DSM 30120]EKT65619.1 glutathione S-transferase [Providencia alcalifaciens Dmel2]EUD08700.1 putative GST-like protein YliJ [Providencia alcalifaciens R90-1475]MBF0692004.1 glutathione S-transferase family protein [Providencia alcalifaciens]
MLTVWGRTNSSNVKKVLWCLKELNIPYNQKDVGGPFGGVDTPEYKKMNPNSTIPTLQDERFTLWESNAILRYLTEKYDHSHLLLAADLQEKAAADKWMDWSGANLFDHIKQMMNKIVRVPEADRDPVQAKIIYQNIEKLLAIADEALSTQAYFSGDKFGIADIAIAPLFYPWHEIVTERPAFPHLERWYQTLTQRPAFQEIVMLPIK